MNIQEKFIANQRVWHLQACIKDTSTLVLCFHNGGSEGRTMKRSLVFLATACALCVAWVLCKGMQADTRTVEIEGEAIPYICQNEKVYVYELNQ